MSQFDKVEIKSKKQSSASLEKKPLMVDYEPMDFDQLYVHPVAGSVVQEMAAKYLRSNDRKWLRDEGFTGHVDSEGFFKLHSGYHSEVRPTDHLSSSDRERVVQMVKHKLKPKIKEDKKTNSGVMLSFARIFFENQTN